MAWYEQHHKMVCRNAKQLIIAPIEGARINRGEKEQLKKLRYITTVAQTLQ